MGQRHALITAKSGGEEFLVVKIYPFFKLPFSHRNYADIPTGDPCKKCYCNNGDLICASQECVPPEGYDFCKPLEVKAGECCPEQYECSEFLVVVRVGSTKELTKLVSSPEAETTTTTGAPETTTVVVDVETATEQDTTTTVPDTTTSSPALPTTTMAPATTGAAGVPGEGRHL